MYNALGYVVALSQQPYTNNTHYLYCSIHIVVTIMLSQKISHSLLPKVFVQNGHDMCVLWRSISFCFLENMCCTRCFPVTTWNSVWKVCFAISTWFTFKVVWLKKKITWYETDWQQIDVKSVGQTEGGTKWRTDGKMTQTHRRDNINYTYLRAWGMPIFIRKIKHIFERLLIGELGLWTSIFF